MSNVSGAVDLDFWDYVCCAKCQMPYDSASGPNIPFWLTECGHVLCNNHLSPDRSCVRCGAGNVQVVPLQRQMDPPMSRWFQSVPGTLHAIAFTAKFQQESMAAQIVNFRSKYRQLQIYIDKLKRDIYELKKANEAFASENGKLRQAGGQIHSGFENNQSPSDFVNSNGKRGMAHPYQYHSETRRRPMTSSSPISINAPPAPDRLTLPPGQSGPELKTNYQQSNANFDSQYSTKHSTARDLSSSQRPTSNRGIQQYAYKPPVTPRLHSQSTMTMSASQSIQPNQPSSRQRQAPYPSNGQIIMPVPPTSSWGAGSRPGTSSVDPSNSQSLSDHDNQQQSRPSKSHPHGRTNMGPPPTPQQQNGSLRPRHSSVAHTNGHSASASAEYPSGQSAARYLTSTPSLPFATAPSSVSGPRRFYPVTGTSADANPASHAIFSPSFTSRPPSRISALNTDMPDMGGDQKASFNPGSQTSNIFR